MHDKKVMPHIEYKRVGDDAVIIRRLPDGSFSSVTMPLDQALILADWIVDSALDHGGADGPEGEPMPDAAPETTAADACTRTRHIDGSIAEHARRISAEVADAFVALGICTPEEGAELAPPPVRLVTGSREEPAPVRYIGNGEFGRA